MRWLLLALALGSSALACGSDEPAGGDDADGGASGGTSPSGGAAGSGTPASGGTAGSSGGAAGTNGGTSSAGASGSSFSGAGPRGGSAGNAGTGGTTAGQWRCDANETVCDCLTLLPELPLAECGAWSCCVYFISDAGGVEAEHCACVNYTEAECEEWVAALAASSNGRREATCPP